MNVNIKFKNFSTLKILENDLDEIIKKILKIRSLFHYYECVQIDFVKSWNLLEPEIKDIPEWVTGISVKNKIIILDVKNNKNNILQLIIHEFVNLALNSREKSIPLWLNEGLAVVLSGQYKNDDIPIKLDKNFNFYNLNYSCINIYKISSNLVYKLIDGFGLENFIAKVKKNDKAKFEENTFFSNRNLLNYYFR